MKRRYLLSIELLIVLIFFTASMIHASGLTVGTGAKMSINNATLTVSKDILINGTLTESAGTINVGGNWTNNGMFTSGLGTVNFFDGQSLVTISGNSIFNNFNAVTTAGKELQFQAGSEQTILGNLNLQGVCGNASQPNPPLTLRSTIPGQQAMINLDTATGTQNIINAVDVKDHSATGQWLAYGLPSQFCSVDSGNNNRWFLQVPTADLSVIKTAQPNPVNAVNQLGYTISVTNNGPDEATNINVIDTLPQGVTNPIVSGSGWDCTIGSGTVTCTMPSLAVGPAAAITITVSAPSEGGEITNTVNVSATEIDPDQVNNSDSVVTTVTPIVNLSITKNDAPDPALAGGNLTYKITVMNSGPSTATNVTVTDTLPPGVSNINASGTGWNCLPPVGNSITCTMPALPPGTAPDITITVSAPLLTGTITNTVIISGSETDTDLSNNDSLTTTKIIAAPDGNADLSITKTDLPDPVPSAGEILTYTITVTNNGPSTATGVTITDTLPAEVTFVSATSSQGDPCTGTTTITCNLGNMANGDSATVIIVVITNPFEGIIGNTATVTGNEIDPIPGNNSATAATNVGGASRLTNISTRGPVLTDDSVMIGGFIISGSEPLTVLIRGFGPTLIDFGVPGSLANPYIDLYSGQTMIATNDNWQTPIAQCDAPAVSCGTPDDILATGKSACFVATTDCHLDGAILVTLPPGAYTVIVRGVSGGTGVGLIGVDEVDTGSVSKLVNISTRGMVLTDDNVMIGGFIIGGGSSNKQVLIRAMGPTLADFGVPGALEDPYIEIYSGQTRIATSDDWPIPIPLCDAPAIWCGTPQDIQSTGKDSCTVATTGCTRDAAILITLPSGPYTAIVRGKNGGTGVGLLGIDEIEPPIGSGP